LARALAPKPRLLLLDEPFSGLDARLRAQVRDEMLHIVHSSGTTTIMVTHDPEEAMYMADRIAVMNRGCVEQIAGPRELYDNPASAFVAMLFSSVNQIGATVRGGGVRTPFGNITAPELAEGTRVDVLVRPESLRVAPAAADAPVPPGAARAHVLTVRMLRRACLLHLCIGDFEGLHLHVHSRVPGRFLPRTGDPVDVTLDRTQAFIFPANPAPTPDVAPPAEGDCRLSSPLIPVRPNEAWAHRK
jgi:iron(III) transport system ATP-binding protein